MSGLKFSQKGSRIAKVQHAGGLLEVSRKNTRLSVLIYAIIQVYCVLVKHYDLRI
jgi:hypothetical protein